ncbi:multidrug resistance-associated ABC transporter [Fomitopsis serialis]|uniref:multidrug resistance-associated ABC transporter n=1 Tax=Fomitopsis serialis TaxID=139415 RepID=UPI002007A534|nr:multidrug resistance-associated ABC transporter [Neoantrodia serialis]KAH9922662.1 multidrug resistance-associated ABC transporter [Neoantrodia serialis]
MSVADQAPLSLDSGFGGNVSVVVAPSNLPPEVSFADATLVFPVVVAAASLVILLIQLGLRSRWQHANKVEAPASPLQSRSKFSQWLAERGGPTIFALNIVRSLSCLVLSILSVATAVHPRPDAFIPKGAYDIDILSVMYAVVPAAYLYTCTLSVAATVLNTRSSVVAIRHLNAVLLVTWGVYVYRDIWPLATYTIDPLDASEGPLLWARFALLTLSAVIVPIIIPHPYLPFDPANPWPNPPAEQTTSWLSFVFFFFVDETIRDASRVEHLSLDKLPPLADYDEAENLLKESLHELDPLQSKKRRHLAWSLWKVWRLEWIKMCFPLAASTALKFVAPLSIRYLLDYIETGGQGASVRPWFWILTLFCGPTFDNLCAQEYTFLSTRLLVRSEAVITQLIFNHALRMRMKAEVSNTPGSEEGSSATPEKPSKTKNLTGKVNNLVTSDFASFTRGFDWLFLLVKVPLELGLCIWFLYSILGWSALVGLATIIILLPAPGMMSGAIHGAEVEKMKKTDARVQSITEAMNVVRMIKFFAWERRIEQQLSEKRNEELMWIRRSKLLSIINDNLNDLIPLLTMVVTYATFTIGMKRELTASVVFSSIAVFETFTGLMHMIMGLIPGYISAKVALDRMTDFLHNTELIDEFADPSGNDHSPAAQPHENGQDVIGFRNATFTWARDDDSGTPALRSGQRNFMLRIDGDVLFKRGCINLVVGPTGSGKTSLLMALLGEMHNIPMGPDSFSMLPRSGGVAYAAQESWVQNETIRDNILFGATYDERRYQMVLEQCALKRDLDLFVAGDLTEVGEKGITLSGGQQARITLARAIYSKAQILLLDDILAALDVHTSRWIVEKCLKGELVRGRTVILVTHNITLAGPIADYVVAVGLDGRVAGQDSISSALERDNRLAAEVAKEDEELAKKKDTLDEEIGDETAQKVDGKLIVEEEVEVGHVGWSAMKLYVHSLGGEHQSLFWLSFMGSLVVFNILNNLQTWFLGFWARQYEEHDASEVHAPQYLLGYCVIMAASIGFYMTALSVYVLGTLRASKIMHRSLISSVFSATLRWLDKTPTARVIARCTQDIQAMDDQVGRWIGVVVDMGTAMLLKLGAVMLISPIFAVPGAIIAFLGGWIGRMYMKAQLSVKREMSNARSPVLGHFGAAFAGIISIRAYGAQEAFKRESYVRINHYTRAARSFWNLNRWVGIRLDVLAALFTAILAAYLVYGRSNTASNIGFSLVMAVGFSSQILWFVRVFNRLEVAGNSVERIKQYLDIEHEPKPTAVGVPPAYWPASGQLKVDKLSARYSENGPRVLHEISFEAKSGERVGIVGRTGSGKSSLALALLRCIHTEGEVFYDGLATDDINLDALRSSITIIPQSPELLSGTLRQNLDPFQQHDDALLNDALQSAGLFSLQSSLTEGKITLDTQIAGGGSNLSVGQRQILALARAIIRQSKLLILDEATSAIDYATDAAIQLSLRKELDRGATVLTVAHRLQTIMDADKIMVLDAGRIVEYGEPRELLKDVNGMFRALVDESPDHDTLHSMANRTGGES